MPTLPVLECGALYSTHSNLILAFITIGTTGPSSLVNHPKTFFRLPMPSYEVNQGLGKPSKHSSKQESLCLSLYIKKEEGKKEDCSRKERSSLSLLTSVANFPFSSRVSESLFSTLLSNTWRKAILCSRQHGNAFPENRMEEH